MALTVITLPPNSTSQLGSVATAVGGTASAVLANSSDATYVQFSARARTNGQVVRVGFATPSIPAGAKVYSVTLKDRIQTVLAGADQPVCNHWFRSVTGVIEVSGQAQDDDRSFFSSTCPTSPTTVTFTDRTVLSAASGPGGKPWNVTDPDTGGAGNLTGFTYDMGRGDDSVVSALRYSKVSLEIAYQQQSGVTVTAPTGTSTSTRPTVTWTYSSPDSQPQQSFEVAVYTAAQAAAPGFVAFTTPPLQTSGVVLSEALQWTLTQDITDGNYKVYVRANSRWAGQGDFPTTVSSSTWTRAGVSVSPPPAAVLSTAVFDALVNRVALTFSRGGSSPASTAFTVQISRDGGDSWESIPSLTYYLADGATPVTLYDYTAELSVISQYRVLAYNGSVLNVATSPSNVLSVTADSNYHWLKDSTNPLRNTIIPIAAPKTSNDGIEITMPRMQAEFQLIGGPNTEVLPIILSGPTYGNQYELELFYGAGNSGLSGQDEINYLLPAFDQLDKRGETLLFQIPNGDQMWCIATPGGGQDAKQTYNARNPKRTQWVRRTLKLKQVKAPSFY